MGSPPGAGDTGEQIVSWLRDHRDGVRWAVWTNTVGAPFGATMFALLRRRLPAPYSDVFLIGAITTLATIAVQSWAWAGLALHADRVEPAIARTVLDVAIFWGPVLTGATMTMIAPVTVLALRGRAGLPKWLGFLGALAFAEQAIETMTVFGSTGFTEPGGAMNLQLGAALVWLWLLGFVIWSAALGPADGQATA